MAFEDEVFCANRMKVSFLSNLWSWACLYSVDNTFCFGFFDLAWVQVSQSGVCMGLWVFFVFFFGSPFVLHFGSSLVYSLAACVPSFLINSLLLPIKKKKNL